MDINEFAGLEYHGIAGSTVDCLRAIERLILCHEDLKSARMLTYVDKDSSGHAFLLTTGIGDEIVIKAGFSSGYAGQGPRGLSSAIALLQIHGVEIEEVEVSKLVIDRLEVSALTESDLAEIRMATPVRPTRLWSYVSEKDYPESQPKNPWRNKQAVLPYGLVDDRLFDLALKFWDDPDAALLKGHRRLETLVRSRMAMSLDEASKLGPAKVFGAAFNGEDAPLTWPEITGSERQGRANLFVGTVSAYRNVRSHREAAGCSHDQLAEFLLLNHLYLLEAAAQPAEPSKTGQSSESEQSGPTSSSNSK